MIDTLPLFGTGSRGGKVPEKKPAKKPALSVTWERLTVKSLPPCDVELRKAHETWRDGVTPFRGIPRARWRRRAVDGTIGLYCSPCAEPRKAADDAVKAGLKAAGVSRRRSG